MADTTSDRIVVAVSKTKTGLILLGSTGFVATNIWLWFNADQDLGRNALFVELAAIAGGTFFAACGLAALFKLFDSAPGLIIDAEGIVDNSSGVSAGRIPWKDIRGFHVTTIRSQRFLTVEVHDAQKYIRRANGLKRLLVSMNAKYFGGPVQISTNALRISFDRLQSLANEALERHRRA
jgi:hypothetical protein